MSAAPLPPNERERLEALNRYALLDTLPEQHYDDLVLLASQICQTPISLISLIDQDRQWFKARIGLDSTQTSRDLSFCAHAILEDGVFEVRDAQRDQRFADNALVTGDPNLRFYAGAPLVSPEGHKLGTLCVIDTQPRQLTDEQLRALETLSRQVIVQMELWRTIKRLEAADRERERVVRDFHSSEDRFRLFMDNSPIMAFVKNAQGRFIYFNQPMSETFQVKPEFLLGKTDFDWLPREVAQVIRANDLRVLQTGETSQLIETVPTPDGKEHQWLVFKFPMPGEDGNKWLGGVALDITERQRVEHLKNEFVSVVSHELRTPLTSIRGALGLLAGGVAGALPTNAANMIGIAHKNAERLVLLINDILDIEKIESGQMNFAFAELPLVPLVQSALEANQGYAENLKVRLVFQPDSSAQNATIRGDEGRLMQVFANLLSNACKFTPEGGQVTISLQPLPNARWRIAITDQGMGVPPEFVPRLFDKFTQANASPTRRLGGTGLGLAIARAIVEQHDGELIYLPPPPGKLGATFAFDLPAYQAEKLLPDESADEPLSDAPRVVVCEDDPEVAQLLQTLLQSENYAVDIASDLETAAQLLAQGDYVGLTLDLLLPDGNGLNLLRQLRSMPATQDLPVVIVSVEKQAQTLNGDTIEVVDWLNKPLDAQRLRAAVRNFGGGASATGARILHVENDHDVIQVTAAILQGAAQITPAHSLAQARELLQNTTYDLAILDVGLPDGNGLELLPLLNAASTPVILFSAQEIETSSAQHVAASLVKTRTSNQALRSTILEKLRNAAPLGNGAEPISLSDENR